MLCWGSRLWRCYPLTRQSDYFKISSQRLSLRQLLVWPFLLNICKFTVTPKTPMSYADCILFEPRHEFVKLFGILPLVVMDNIPIWPNKRGPLGIFRVHEGHRYGGFNTIWRSKLLVAFSVSQERHRKERFKPYKHKHFSGLLRGKNKAFSPTVCGTTKELLVSFSMSKRSEERQC